MFLTSRYTAWVVPRVGLGALVFGLVSAAAQVAPAVKASTEPPARAPRTTAPPARVPQPSQAFFQYLLSEIAGQRGEGAFAAQGLTELADRTRDPRVARRAAELAFQAKRYEEARLALLIWIELEPDAQTARQGLAALLGGYSRDGLAAAPPTLDAALAALAAWQSDARFAPVVLSEAPSLLARFTDREAAWQGARRWPVPKTAKPEYHYALGSLALAAGRVAEAEAEIARALMERPQWSNVILLNAQLMRSQDEKLPSPSDRANRYLASFLEQRPDANEVRIAYARALVAEKAFLSGREQFRIASRLAPKNAELIYATALLSQQMDDHADAEAQYRRVLALQPRDPSPVFYNLGMVAEARRNPTDAKDWYAKVGSGDYYVPSQLRVAALIAKQDGVEAARIHLRKLREGSGVGTELRLQLALAEVQVLREARAFGPAHEAITELIKEYPSSAEYHYDRAMISERLNRLDDAERDLRRAIALKPDYAHAYNALGYTFVERGMRLDEAEILLKQAQSLAPGDAFIQDSIGWLYFKQGKITEALNVLRAAYAARPDAEIAAHLGEVMWADGQREAALMFLRAARLRYPESDALGALLERLVK